MLLAGTLAEPRVIGSRRRRRPAEGDAPMGKGREGRRGRGGAPLQRAPACLRWAARSAPPGKGEEEEGEGGLSRARRWPWQGEVAAPSS